MDTLKSKVAYLQGLAQGLDIKQETKEGRLLSSIIDVLGEMTQEVSMLRDRQSDLQDYIEAIDEDLASVEDEVSPIDEEDVTEIECPACGNTLVFEVDPFEDDEVLEITCPGCGESIYEDGFEIDEDDNQLDNHDHPLKDDDIYHKE